MPMLPKVKASQQQQIHNKCEDLRRLTVAVSTGYGQSKRNSRMIDQRTTNNTSIPRSLLGVLTSKRLARKFASRFHNRKGFGSTSGHSAIILKEPSYRMEPQNRFNVEQVNTMLISLLDDRLSKARYSSKISPNMCKIISEEIKDSVKQMNFDRYKIVSNVLIGQRKDQAIFTASRYAWDTNMDTFVSFTFQNEHIFCTATVYGVYSE